MKRCFGCNRKAGEANTGDTFFGRLHLGYCGECRKGREGTERRASYAKRVHGISLEQYEKRVLAPCLVCREKERIALFKTGVCRRCTSGLAMFQGDVALLKRAIEYLTGTKKRRHPGRTK